MKLQASEITYKLKLSVEEAKWFKQIMQNPLNCVDLGDENGHDNAMRLQELTQMSDGATTFVGSNMSFHNHGVFVEIDINKNELKLFDSSIISNIIGSNSFVTQNEEVICKTLHLLLKSMANEATKNGGLSADEIENFSIGVKTESKLDPDWYKT